MGRIRSRNNIAIEQSIMAVARAHARLPGVDLVRAKELAAKIDGPMGPYMTAECTIALCIQLLRTLGVADAFHESRLRGH